MTCFDMIWKNQFDFPIIISLVIYYFEIFCKILFLVLLRIEKYQKMVSFRINTFWTTLKVFVLTSDMVMILKFKSMRWKYRMTISLYDKNWYQTSLWIYLLINSSSVKNSFIRVTLTLVIFNSDSIWSIVLPPFIMITTVNV